MITFPSKDPLVAMPAQSNLRAASKIELHLPKGERNTLSSHDEAGYAIWNTCACGQKRDPHDDIRDSQGVTNYGDLKRHRDGSVNCKFTQIQKCFD